MRLGRWSGSMSVSMAVCSRFNGCNGVRVVFLVIVVPGRNLMSSLRKGNLNG